MLMAPAVFPRLIAQNARITKSRQTEDEGRVMPRKQTGIMWCPDLDQDGSTTGANLGTGRRGVRYLEGLLVELRCGGKVLRNQTKQLLAGTRQLGLPVLRSGQSSGSGWYDKIAGSGNGAMRQ